jgi:hypothetical protein
MIILDPKRVQMKKFSTKKFITFENYTAFGFSHFSIQGYLKILNFKCNFLCIDDFNRKVVNYKVV